MDNNTPLQRPNNEYNGYQLTNGIVVWLPVVPSSWKGNLQAESGMDDLRPRVPDL
jgi:hypothetical protein